MFEAVTNVICKAIDHLLPKEQQQLFKHGGHKINIIDANQTTSNKQTEIVSKQNSNMGSKHGHAHVKGHGHGGNSSQESFFGGNFWHAQTEVDGEGTVHGATDAKVDTEVDAEVDAELQKWKTFLPQVNKMCGTDLHAQVALLTGKDRHAMLAQLSGEAGMDVFAVVNTLALH